ncbi:MAG: YqgE/AlgH family protein [Deltaproteobacteria bacterium]|jgi:putative transcriptional regulator|nr:YqgE/AlgH family protein [Deltaproteobacteria bacterium]
MKSDWKKFVLAVITFCVLNFAPGLVMTALSEMAPQAGRLLVAGKDLADPRFHQSVILLIQHDATGTGGVVINRPSQLPLRELFAAQPDFAGLAGNLFYGGPVAPEYLIALLKTSMSAPGSMKPVIDNLYLSSLDLLLEWLSAQPDEPDYRVYSGYAGWAPGQLADEIQRGDWLVLPTDAESVFDSDTTSLWERLQKTRVM